MTNIDPNSLKVGDRFLNGSGAYIRVFLVKNVTPSLIQIFNKSEGETHWLEKKDLKIMDLLPPKPSVVKKVAKTGFKITWFLVKTTAIIAIGYAIAHLKVLPSIFAWYGRN